jgi:hypothetical protein
VCLRPPALVRLIRALALHVPRCLNWTKLRSYAPLVVTVNLGRLWTVRGFVTSRPSRRRLGPKWRLNPPLKI